MSVHNENDLKCFLKGRHSTSKLITHLVFTTKYRRKLLNGKMISDLESAIASACDKLACNLIELNGESDHIHILIEYPPKLAISVLVNNLKSISSRQLRLAHPDLKKQSNNGTLWSRSYFAASAGGVTIETLKKYVESQNTPK